MITKRLDLVLLLLSALSSQALPASIAESSTQDLASSPEVEPTCANTAGPACDDTEVAEEEDDVEKECGDLDDYDEQDYTLEDVYTWRADDTEDHDWENLDCDQKVYLINEYGFNKHTWECRADPETLMSFEELPPERQKAWAAKGFTKENWDVVEPDPCELPLQRSTPEDFNPILVDLDVPEVDKYSTEWLKQVQQPVRMLDGYNRKVGDERFTSTMPLGEVVRSALEDNLNFMMFLEQDQHEKHLLNQLIGDHVIEVFKEAVHHNPIFRETGNWNPAWYYGLQRRDYDWAMIMAPKGSTTPTHYDTDWFNMLYLVEGKKRVILLPNDERTAGTFETSLNEDGGTAWGHINMINATGPLPQHAREFIVTAGQALVIPRFTWHTVENLEVSLSYNLRIDG